VKHDRSMRWPSTAPFRPPAGRAGHVFRPRLVFDATSERTRPVVVVQAPAGYGKSTLAAQWCRSVHRPVAWLSLRDSDNDVVQLLSRLTVSLEGLGTVDAELIGDLHSPEPPIEAVLFPRFLDDLALRAPFQLALDDAHVIDHPRALAVLNGLVNAIPNGSQLILVSRTDPRVGLARLRAAGDLHELGARDLALDDGETRQLFSLAGIDLSESEASGLCATTEGWAAGLAMAAMSRSKADQASPFGPWALAHRDIADYFREEVLERESDDVRRFLRATSLVERISGPLCDAMTGRHDSAQLLDELARTNLFVVRVDNDRHWFRYHHLLQDLLQKELHRDGDHAETDLLNRAAAWHEDHGDPAEAFEYARRGNDFDRAGRILLGHWDEYLGTGRSDTVMRWLNRCREQDIVADPQFAIAAGWITAHLGDAERANRYLAAAERCDLAASSADGATSLHAAMLSLRGSLGTRGAAQMLKDGLEFVASELPARSRYLLEGYLIVGEGHLFLGHTTEAIAAFHETLVLTETKRTPHHVYARAWVLGLLALAYADRGDWDRAERDARMAGELLTGRDLIMHRIPMLTARATIAVHAGDGAAGASAIAEAREIMPTALAVPCLQAEMSLRCAQAALALGDDGTASALVWDTQMACRRLEDPGSLPDRLNTLRERMVGIDPLRGLLTPAEKRVLVQLASHRTLLEIAQRLYVSRYTVKTHVASIYAKLGVSARADAVAALGDPLVAQAVARTKSG
jgi:LuxR family transcriptional regulator, maltose regulon positive regulatory protein